MPDPESIKIEDFLVEIKLEGPNLSWSTEGHPVPRRVKYITHLKKFLIFEL